MVTAATKITTAYGLPPLLGRHRPLGCHAYVLIPVILCSLTAQACFSG